MQGHPLEAIDNNVFGTESVALAAKRLGVGKFVLISSDKAVCPVGVVGMTKRVAEGDLGDHDTELSRISGRMNRLAHFDGDDVLRSVRPAENLVNRDRVAVPPSSDCLPYGPLRPNDRDLPLASSRRATEVEREVHALGDRSFADGETGSGGGPAKGPSVVSGRLDPVPPLPNHDARRQGDFFSLHGCVPRLLAAIDLMLRVCASPAAR